MAKKPTNAQLAKEVADQLAELAEIRDKYDTDLAELAEIREQLKALIESESGTPFEFPEEVTEPQAKLVYALADLTGKLETIQKSHDTGGRGDFSYSYASVFDMLDMVRPLLSNRGLIMTGNELLEHPKYLAEEFDRGNGKVGMKVLLPTEWTIEHWAGGFKSVIVMGEARDTTDKAHSKAKTASQKTALRSLTGISTGEPEDTEQEHIEQYSSSNAQRSQAGQQSGSSQRSASGINPKWGECVLHTGKGFYLTDAAKKANHGPSHKTDEGNFCEYLTTLETIREVVGARITAELGDGDRFVAWHNTESGLNLAHPGKFSMFRAIDYQLIAQALDVHPPTPPEAIDVSNEGVVIDGVRVCGEPVDDGTGIEAGCGLPPGHTDEFEHVVEPSLSEIAEAQAGSK